MVQEELLRLAKREREAAGEVLSTALQRERSSTNEERKRAAQLVSNGLCYVPMRDRLESLCLKGFIKCHLYVEFRNCFSLKRWSPRNSTPWLRV